MTVRYAYHANCWGDLGGNAVGVTSITQLTYRTFGDMSRAISEIGEAGYEGVELFDGNRLDFEGRYSALRSVLSDAGVTLSPHTRAPTSSSRTSSVKSLRG